MRTVTVVENVSLDGVMQAPASPVVPVVLGSGSRLFGDAPLRLSVRRHEAFPSGITVTRWAVER